jgi:hypothetical protein
MPNVVALHFVHADPNAAQLVQTTASKPNVYHAEGGMLPVLKTCRQLERSLADMSPTCTCLF